MSSETLKLKIEQTVAAIRLVRESLALSRMELRENPGRAREIMIGNTEILKEGWKLKDELEQLEAEMAKIKP